MRPLTRMPGTPSRSSGISTAAVSLRPKALLAAVLSISCVFSLGVELPASAGTPAVPAKDKKSKQDPVLKGLPVTELSVDEAVLHAMNRLAYGPRPGDVERVKQLGLAKWIDQQLAPNSIDDKALNARLENFPTLTMSSARLIEDYPQPKQAEKQAEKRAAANAVPNNESRPSTAAGHAPKNMQDGANGNGQSANETMAPQFFRRGGAIGAQRIPRTKTWPTSPACPLP